MYELPLKSDSCTTQWRTTIPRARYFDLASRLPGGKDRAGRFAALYTQRVTADIDSQGRRLPTTDEQPYLRDLARHYVEK